MEASGNLIFRFPSQLPEAVAALFPAWKAADGTGSAACGTNEAESVLARCMEEGNGKRVYLFNPPPELLRRLPRETDAVVAFDALPPVEVMPHLKTFRVQVPSLAFRSMLNRHGVHAEVMHPVPAVPEKAGEKRKQVRKRLKLSPRQLVVWIDERLVSAKFRHQVYEVLRQAHRHAPGIKAIWVSQRMKPKWGGMITMDPQAADGEQGWLAADLLVTTTPVRQSLVPVHLQCLAAGIPVLTDEAGDHDEWVKHLFAGAVISRKGYRQELRHYLQRAATDPEWVSDMKQNAKMLARLAAEEA